MIELRYVKRDVEVPVATMEGVVELKEALILQQRTKKGTYADFSEWHDVPTVEEEADEE